MVVFGSDERDVVTLRHARKALAEITRRGSSGMVVTMGLTTEADAELRGAGVIVARSGGFAWTEDSYRQRR